MKIITTEPLERYVIDTIELPLELKKGKKKYLYLLSVIDHFTKF